MVGLLSFAGVLSLARPAGAAPGLTLAGAAPASAHGPGSITFTYTIVAPTPVDAAAFTTRQDAALPARTTGATLDGAAVPAAQISQSGASDIAIQVGPADGLAAGTHTITFQAAIGSTTASSSSTAILAWTQSGTPRSVTSAPVVVAMNEIDIATVLTPDSGEDQLGFLGTGADSYLAVDVQNLGYGMPHSQLVVDLPIGLALGSAGVAHDADGAPLSCAAAPGNAQQIVCDLGVLAHGTGAQNPTLAIDLTTTPAAVIGQIVAITVTSSPKPGEGTDLNPANNSVTAHLKFSGTAALVTTITPAANPVALGASTTVRLTVHNSGPQPAGRTIAFSILLGDNFAVTGFTGNTTPPPGLGSTPGSTPLGLNQGVVFWFVGDIASGDSVSATLTLKAVKLGSTEIVMIAASEASDPNCPDLDCDPAAVTLRVVDAAPTSTPTPPPASPAGAGQPVTRTDPSGALANTGATASQQGRVGGLLLVVGFALVFLGRRRRIGNRSGLQPHVDE
jgi:LPXTG-motif cell wall-anchored protein